MARFLLYNKCKTFKFNKLVMMKFFNYFPFDWENSSLMNIKETSENYVINFRAVGLDKEDVEINVDGDILSISTKVDKSNTDWGVQQEFLNDRINKKVELPDDVDVDNISAEMKKGILEIQLPKVKTSIKKKSIQVG
jgi:HSP20 family protein